MSAFDDVRNQGRQIAINSAITEAGNLWNDFKGGVKRRVKNVTKGAKQAAKKVQAGINSVKKQAKTMQKKFEKRVDAHMSKNKGPIQKAWNATKNVAKKTVKTAAKIVPAPLRKTVAKVAKSTAKSVAKVIPPSVCRAAAKVASKGILKGVSKSAILKVPVAGLVYAGYCAGQSIAKGNYFAAACDLASGAASCFPPVGTAVSLGIDFGQAGMNGYNLYKEDKQIAKAQQVKDMNNLGASAKIVSRGVQAELQHAQELLAYKKHYSKVSNDLCARPVEIKKQPPQGNKEIKPITPAEYAVLLRKSINRS